MRQSERQQERHDRNHQRKVGEPGRIGVMNGVTAFSIRKMAGAASVMRCASASRAIEELSPPWRVVTCIVRRQLDVSRSDILFERFQLPADRRNLRPTLLA
jgi:hypothetical protein